MALNDNVPSNAFDVLQKNMEVTDEFVNSNNLTVSTRGAPNGKSQIKTITGIEKDAADAISNSFSAYIGAWSAGVTTFNAPNEYAEFNGITYKPKSGTVLPYVAQGADPTIAPDNASVEPFSDVNSSNINSKSGGKENYISNPQFQIAGTVTTPPSATPTDYVIGDEIYSGFIATSAIVGMTDVGGLKNATSGTAAFYVPNASGLEFITTFKASLTGLDINNPTETGVTYTLDGDNYKIEIDFSVASNVFSAKFEAGNFATGHEVWTPRQKSFPSISEVTGVNIGDSIVVDDYYGGANPNNSGALFFKVVAGGTGTADGGKYIDLPNGFQLEQNLKRPFNPRAWGAMADNATDTIPAWDAMTLYIRQNYSGAEVQFSGNYYFSTAPVFYSAFIYQGGGKGNTSINVPPESNGVQINPPLTPTASISFLEMRDFSIKSTNTYPAANENKGINIDLTAACRRLNIRDVDISGFKNGVDGRCPFYLCTFKNMQINGIVPRDINDIPNYTNDNSYGFASGFNDQVGDVRDATTVTMENVFTGSFGIGIHNRYTAAMQLINCVSERNFYGVLADKGLYGTMYQEWNKEAVKIRGTFEPSGVQITAINEPASWGTVTADTIKSARGSYFRTLVGGREYQTYTDVLPVVVSTSTQYFEFQELNGEAITQTSAPPHRILGLYEIEVDFYKTSDPSLQGTYIFDVWVKEDEEPAFRNVKRGFLKVLPDDDFLGTLNMNYKGTVRGNLSNFRVSVSRVDGEGFTFSGSDISATVRRLSN